LVIGNWKWLSSFFPNYLKYSGLGLLATIGAIQRGFCKLYRQRGRLSISLRHFQPSRRPRPACCKFSTRHHSKQGREKLGRKTNVRSVLMGTMFAASFWLLDIGY